MRQTGKNNLIKFNKYLEDKQKVVDNKQESSNQESKDISIDIKIKK